VEQLRTEIVLSAEWLIACHYWLLVSCCRCSSSSSRSQEKEKGERRKLLLLLFTGSEFLGAVINVRFAAKKPPGQQQKPRRTGRQIYSHFESNYCSL